MRQRRPGRSANGCVRPIRTKSLFAQTRLTLGDAKVAPLGKSGVAVRLEIVSAVESSFLVELVMGCRGDCGEFL